MHSKNWAVPGPRTMQCASFKARRSRTSPGRPKSRLQQQTPYRIVAVSCAGMTAAPCAMEWAVVTTSTAAHMMPPSVTPIRASAHQRMARRMCLGPLKCRLPTPKHPSPCPMPRLRMMRCRLQLVCRLACGLVSKRLQSKRDRLLFRPAALCWPPRSV